MLSAHVTSTSGTDNNARVLRLLSTNRFLGVLLVGVLAVVSAAGLHPFNFLPRNQVSWVPDGPGVRFSGYGEMVGFWPSLLGRSDTSSAPDIGLEFWVSSFRAHGETSELNEIFSVYHSRRQKPFAINEWKTDLEVGGIFRNSKGSTFRHIGINHVFSGQTRRFITITSGAKGTAIYLDGLLQETSPGLVLVAENFPGTLMLGQTLQGTQEWHGDICGLAIYGYAPTQEQVAEHYRAWRSGDWQVLRSNGPAAIYPFNEGGGNLVHNRGDIGEDLVIPRKLKALDPVILATPTQRDFTNFSDIAVNLAGFIPLGFLLALYLRNFGWADRNVFVAAVVVGLVVSLAIEFLQALLPSRDSSLLDVINNTLGTGIGAWLAIRVTPWVQKTCAQHRRGGSERLEICANLWRPCGLQTKVTIITHS